jgi:hypothetical protein
MTSSKVFSRRYLTTEAATTHAGAYHETALSLAGRPKALWENITGAPAVAGEVQSVEVNPQNEVGYDMSGPPFGAAQLLPVWWVGLDAPANTGRFRANAWRAVADTARIIRGRFWVRPHAVALDGTAPLDRLLFTWRAAASSAVASTFSAILRNRRTGQIHVFPRSTGSTATQAWSETLELIPVDPGLNDFTFEVVRNSGTATLTVRCMALTVCAKRKHGISFPG